MASIDNSLLPSAADTGGTSSLTAGQYGSLLTQGIGGLTSAFGSYYQAQGQSMWLRSQNSGLKLQALGLKNQMIGEKGQLIAQKYRLIGDKSQLAGQKTSLDFQAHIAALNATLAELAAQDALDQGKRQVQQVQLATGQMVGTQRASMAARGIDLSSATPVNIQAGTKLMGEVDANTLQLNAMRQAWGLRMQATGYQNESLMAAAGAKSAGLMGDAIDPNVINPDAVNPDAIDTTWMDKIKPVSGASPGLALAGSLLSGVGKVASSWYGYNKAG